MIEVKVTISLDEKAEVILTQLINSFNGASDAFHAPDSMKKSSTAAAVATMNKGATNEEKEGAYSLAMVTELAKTKIKTNREAVKKALSDLGISAVSNTPQNLLGVLYEKLEAIE